MGASTLAAPASTRYHTPFVRKAQVCSLPSWLAPSSHANTRGTLETAAIQILTNQGETHGSPSKHKSETANTPGTLELAAMQLLTNQRETYENIRAAGRTLLFHPGSPHPAISFLPPWAASHHTTPISVVFHPERSIPCDTSCRSAACKFTFARSAPCR